jgi:hypothetical protein
MGIKIKAVTRNEMQEKEMRENEELTKITSIRPGQSLGGDNVTSASRIEQMQEKKQT